MKSKWFKLKPEAIKLRKKGISMTFIEKKYGIPRSTLSGWFKNIILNKLQKKKLDRGRKKALIYARQKALIWHNTQKIGRLRKAEQEGQEVLEKINNDNNVTELALALLYLGEGFKKSTTTGMGNTDPLILKFFLDILIKIYNVNIKNIALFLHLRADQDPEKIKKYWAQQLHVPLNVFRKTSIDKRTAGTKTYPSYKGVCVINCGNVAIQRRLVYIGRKYCEQTIHKLRA